MEFGKLLSRIKVHLTTESTSFMSSRSLQACNVFQQCLAHRRILLDQVDLQVAKPKLGHSFRIEPASCLVPDQHDDNVRFCTLPQLLEQSQKRNCASYSIERHEGTGRHSHTLCRQKKLSLSFSSQVFHDQPKHISFGQKPGSTFNWQSTLTQFPHSSPEHVYLLREGRRKTKERTNIPLLKRINDA